MSSEAMSFIASAKIAGYAGAVMVFEYLHIPQQQVTILAMLMLIDFVTGIGKQYQIDPVQIRSHTAWVGVMKKSATFLAIGTIALMFLGLGLNGRVYLDSLMAILIMAEGYSIIQNVYAIRTGNILPEFDVVSIMLKAISKFLEKKIESMIKVESNHKKH